MDANEGVLNDVICNALPLCQIAARKLVRKGPGRPPVIPDWFIGLMIMVAIAKGKKSKAAQFRFWEEHQWLLADYQGDWKFPARSTFYERYRRERYLRERYRRVWRIFEQTIEIHTGKAIGYRWIDPEVVSVDKSVADQR